MSARVLLFGSAARGEATAESDVDLVVIFDDLDYRYRQEIEAKLQGDDRPAIGCPVRPAGDRHARMGLSHPGGDHVG